MEDKIILDLLSLGRQFSLKHFKRLNHTVINYNFFYLILVFTEIEFTVYLLDSWDPEENDRFWFKIDNEAIIFSWNKNE